MVTKKANAVKSQLLQLVNNVHAVLVLAYLLCFVSSTRVLGCSFHDNNYNGNSELGQADINPRRTIFQVDEFPKGRYSIIDSEAFPTPTVPGELSARLGNETSRQYGTGGIPFTTSGAYSELQDFSQTGDPIVLKQEPSNLIPWSATGKLVLSSGDWCTAALIAPNVAVTAAHCLCVYGSNTVFSGTATFVSGKFDNAQFIKADVEAYFPAEPYCDGTDTCTVPGQECENDLAVLSLGPINTPSTSPYVGNAPGSVAGYYSFRDGDYSYVSYAGYQSTQITALGYAANLDDGNKMIRTDSLGIQSGPNQVKIGSTMEAGLGGSPFIVNFGIPQTDSAAPGTASDPNVMVAVAGWYSSDSNVKIIGGSRFNKNSKYTQYSNILTLVNTYCCTLSQAERDQKCAGIQQCLDEVSPSPPPPTPGTTDWIQGVSGASCTATCQASGKTCNIGLINQITTIAQALNVAEYCGISGADTLDTYNGIYNDGPTIWNSLLQYDGSASTCDGSYENSLRFCCCGSNCPSSASPPPVPSPSPSPTPPSSSPSPSPSPSPPPGPNTNPGIPTNVVQAGNTADSVTITWTDGSPGNPVETYKVLCMMYPDGCNATPLKEVLNIPRGTQQAVVTGLLPSTLYSCFVVANNGANDVCSSVVTVNYQNSGSCAKRDLLETGPRPPKEKICGTPDPTPAQIESSLQKQIATFGTTVAEFKLDQLSAASTFSATVPIFFYTCTQSYSIPQAQLDAQVQVLNEDYALSGIQFTSIGRQECSGQQQTDWLNNLGTNTNINAGFNYLQNLAATLRKNAILVTLGDWSGSQGLLGIAELGLSTYPVQFNNPGTLPGGSSVPFNLGRTMTHELGHNLGLYHVFDSGCTGNGDLIPDTPNGNTNYQCPVGRNSCTSSPGKDAINNFMDYTDDCCMNIFSPRQGLAMQAEIQQSKPSWVNP